jgi:hypothetical protein
MSTNGKSDGAANPPPLSQLRTELIWEGKYDEYGNRREVDVAGSAMPMQKIDFRNTRVTHQEKEIADPKETEQHLLGWVKRLKALTEAARG